MTKVVTYDCACTVTYYGGQKRPERCEEHGNRFLTEAQKIASEKPRATLRPVSEKRAAEEEAGTRPRSYGSTLKQTATGFTAAPAQRAKVKDAISIISGEGPCDPVHIWDRRLGGCDDPLCVFPATRFEHREYEEKRLDILPALVAGGYFAEMAHVIEAHDVSPKRLLERLTGRDDYRPISDFSHELEALQGRIVELESRIAA
jgi:hypothetical protein